jgi:hypothetical protein
MNCIDAAGPAVAAKAADPAVATKAVVSAQSLQKQWF